MRRVGLAALNSACVTDVEAIVLQHRAKQIAARQRGDEISEWLAERMLNNWLEHYDSLIRLRSAVDATLHPSAKH